MTRMSGLLGSMAKERIRDELMRILVARRPSRAFYLMARTGLLKEILPELLEGYRKRQNRHHRYTIFSHIMVCLDRIEPEPELRLTALLHDIAKPRVRERTERGYRILGHEKASGELAGAIMRRLKFSNDMVRQVTHLIEHHMAVVGYHSGWGDGALRRLIRRIGPENMDRFLAFHRADLEAHGPGRDDPALFTQLKERVEALLEGRPPLRTRDLAINGYKVMEILGVGPGPEVGRALADLMDQVTDRPEWNTEERLTGLLKDRKSAPP